MITGIGGLLLLVGAVWFLQGVGILPGSFMTGDPTWAFIGGACLVAGIVVLVVQRLKKPS